MRALVHREDERADALRRQGAEVVLGDLDDHESVKAALQGVDRRLLLLPDRTGMVRATALFAHAAKAAGVEAVVNMSQIIAREDARSHASFDHWLAERVFDASGVPVTHLRPTFFAEWLLYLAPMIGQGQVFMAFGPGKAALIAAEDQGRVIAARPPGPEAPRGEDLPAPGSGRADLGGDRGRRGPGPRASRSSYQQVPFEAMRDAMLGNRADRPARNDASTGYAESNPPDASGESHIAQHLREAARTTTTASSPAPTTSSSGSPAGNRPRSRSS